MAGCIGIIKEVAEIVIRARMREVDDYCGEYADGTVVFVRLCHGGNIPSGYGCKHWVRRMMMS